MKQVLAKIHKSPVLVQDLQVIQEPKIQSNAMPVACCVCGKGLESGYSLTAKSFCGKTVFLCNLHF